MISTTVIELQAQREAGYESETQQKFKQAETNSFLKLPPLGERNDEKECPRQLEAVQIQVTLWETT